MGSVERQRPVKVFVGLLAKETVLFDDIRKPLERLFGPIDIESPVLDFSFTNYYRKEMGEPLKRKFYGFARLSEPDRLTTAKIKTNDLERRFAFTDEARRINIDPGYLDLSKVILFTTKDHAHRIHVRGGIFAEITLSYRDKRFIDLPWTYPDYRSAGYLAFFGAVRDSYKKTFTGR